MVDLVCLRSFVHVYEGGTVAAAAAGLGYTPPAVSQHVARLEREVGALLFDRVAGRLRPTGTGERLRELADELLDLEERCRRLGAAEEDDRGPVTVVGCASAITEIVVPRLAPSGRPVTVRGVDDDQALRELRLGTADVAVVQRYGDEPVVQSGRFHHVVIAVDPLRLVLPAGTPSDTALEDLVEPRWLLNGDDSACTRSVLGLLAAAGVRPVVTGSVDDNQAMLRLVAAGLGACIVPELVLRAAGPPAGLTVGTARLPVARTIVAVTRSSTAGRHRRLLDALAAPHRNAPTAPAGVGR